MVRRAGVVLTALACLLTVGGVAPTAAAVSGRTLYVSPSGSDTQPGTRSEPWRTLKWALAALLPGDTLRVRGGTYVERVTAVALHPGRHDARVLVQAERGERPVVQGLLELRRPSYWTLDGINVTWDDATGAADEHMVKIVDGVGWTFEHAEVWGARSYAGVLVAGTVRGEPSGWAISGNCVHDTYPTNGPNQDQLLYVNTGLDAGPGVVQGNLLFGAANGIGVKLGGPSASEGGAARVEVRYNTIYDTAQGILIAWASRDNGIRRNIIDRSGAGYGNIRSFELTGSGNIVSENVGGGADRFLLEDPGYGRVVSGPGNLFPVDPRFDRVSGCDGFHPGNPVAVGSGRYAEPASGPRARWRPPWFAAALVGGALVGAAVLTAGLGRRGRGLRRPGGHLRGGSDR